MSRTDDMSNGGGHGEPDQRERQDSLGAAVADLDAEGRTFLAGALAKADRRFQSLLDNPPDSHAETEAARRGAYSWRLALALVTLILITSVGGSVGLILYIQGTAEERCGEVQEAVLAQVNGRLDQQAEQIATCQRQRSEMAAELVTMRLWVLEKLEDQE